MLERTRPQTWLQLRPATQSMPPHSGPHLAVVDECVHMLPTIPTLLSLMRVHMLPTILAARLLVSPVLSLNPRWTTGTMRAREGASMVLTNTV